MPPAPAFDYYLELELERSASTQDITSSFRRLAMLYHPDRNPDNQQEATSRFQRLQLAYETLSDLSKRSRYDNIRPAVSCPFDFDDEDDGTWEDGHDGLHDFFEELRRFQEQYGEVLREQRRRREEAEEARLRAQRAAKRNADLAKEAQKNQQREAERERQERRWKEMKAIADDERLTACLHSDFCKKIQQQKKSKCSVCFAKRGLMAFECPYCSAFLCQLCVTKFSDRRRRMYRSGRPNVSTTAQSPQDHAEDPEPANEKTKANGDKDDKTEPKDTEPIHEHKKSRTTEKPTPGATRGFIRNTIPKQRAPDALLRQAMEKFGTVASLKVTNKYVGTARVEFSDPDGLCKAMAASPVVVNGHAVVTIVELKKCSKCGRFGHNAEQCRGAKAPDMRR